MDHTLMTHAHATLSVMPNMYANELYQQDMPYNNPFHVHITLYAYSHTHYGSIIMISTIHMHIYIYIYIYIYNYQELIIVKFYYK